MPTVAVDTPDRTMLREAHRVRALTPQEEGTGLLHLPAGVYGFTHAPAAENAPLFASATRHSFEVHRLQNSAVLLAYVDRQAAAVLEQAPEDFKVLAHPFPGNDATILVAIEWSRLHLIKRYLTPTKDGAVELQVFGTQS
jgi:hypothetical protein